MSYRLVRSDDSPVKLMTFAVAGSIGGAGKEVERGDFEDGHRAPFLQ